MDKQLKIILEFQDMASAGLARAVGGIQTAVGGLQAGVGKGFSGILSSVGGAIKGTIGWLGSLVARTRWASLFVGTALVGIAKNAIDLTAEVEQARVAFETLLKSPEQAGDLLSWITKISLQTPATRSEIQKLAQTFLAYDHNLEETKTALMATLEATSALGISETRLNAITYNLGQIATSTTVSYREFRDLQKQGINTAKLLAGAVNDGSLKLAGHAKALVGSANALKTLTREQQEAIIKQNEGKNIAVALEEQMIKTYGGASLRQVKTLAGAISNFADVYQYVLQRAMGISLKGEVIVGGAFDKIRKAAATAVEFLLNNVDKISEFFNKILSNSKNLETIFVFILASFSSFILGIAGPALLLGGIITGIVKLAGFLVEKFGGLKNITSGLQDIWSTFSTFFSQTFLPAFKRFGDEVLPPIVDAFKKLGPPLQEFGKAFMELLPFLIVGAAVIVTFAAAILTGLVTALAQVLPNIIGIFTGIVQVITGFLQFIAGLVSLNGEMIKQSLALGWQGIYNIVSNFTRGISNLVSGFVNGIINFFRGLYMALVGGSIVWDIVNGIIGAFEMLKTKVVDAVKGLVDAITGIISGFKPTISIGLNLPDVVGAWNSLKQQAHKIGVPGFQHGGIVPGPVGAPMPAIVHGGERIIPRGGETRGGGGGGVTINMNGPITMDSPNRVKELANEVMRIMGRQSELSKYGIGVSFA